MQCKALSLSLLCTSAILCHMHIIRMFIRMMPSKQLELLHVSVPP